MTNRTSIRQAALDFLDTVRLARAKNTFETYNFALRAFQDSLSTRNIDLDGPVSSLTEDAIAWFADYLKDQSPATETLYLQAARSFFNFLAAEKLAPINLPRLDLLKQSVLNDP